MAEYPSARGAIDELIHDKQLAGRTAKAYFRLPADFVDRLPEVVPVLVYPLGGGTIGAIDRVDRVGVDVYGDGPDALDVAEAIVSLVVNDGMPHDLTVGYIDDITVETLPNDVPYPTPGVNQSQTVFRVTSRPL